MSNTSIDAAMAHKAELRVFNAGRATILLGRSVCFDEKIPNSSKSLSFSHLFFSISHSFAIIRRSKKQVNTRVQSTCWQILGLIICILHNFRVELVSGSFTDPFPPPLAEKTSKMVPLKTWVASVRACRVFSQWYHGGRRRREAGF